MDTTLFQTFVLFGFYVVMTKIDTPDGARAGFATAACVTLIVFVATSIKRTLDAHRDASSKR